MKRNALLLARFFFRMKRQSLLLLCLQHSAKKMKEPTVCLPPPSDSVQNSEHETAGVVQEGQNGRDEDEALQEEEAVPLRADADEDAAHSADHRGSRDAEAKSVGFQEVRAREGLAVRGGVDEEDVAMTMKIRLDLFLLPFLNRQTQRDLCLLRETKKNAKRHCRAVKKTLVCSTRFLFLHDAKKKFLLLP